MAIRNMSFIPISDLPHGETPEQINGVQVWEMISGTGTTIYALISGRAVAVQYEPMGGRIGSEDLKFKIADELSGNANRQKRSRIPV